MVADDFQVVVDGRDPVRLPSYGKTCREFDRLLKEMAGTGATIVAWRIRPNGLAERILSQTCHPPGEMAEERA